MHAHKRQRQAHGHGANAVVVLLLPLRLLRSRVNIFFPFYFVPYLSTVALLVHLFMFSSFAIQLSLPLWFPIAIPFKRIVIGTERRATRTNSVLILEIPNLMAKNIFDFSREIIRVRQNRQKVSTSMPKMMMKKQCE